MYAQNAEKKDKFSPDTPLFEELTNVKKKTDKFNLYLNMQGSFDAHFRDGFQEGDFNMHQLRIEAKGNINNWLSYRYRQRLNRSNDANGMICLLYTSIIISSHLQMVQQLQTGTYIDTYFRLLLVDSGFLFKVEIKIRTGSQINTG